MVTRLVTKRDTVPRMAEIERLQEIYAGGETIIDDEVIAVGAGSQWRQRVQGVTLSPEASSREGVISDLLYRLRLGQRWLIEQHERFLAADPTAASDELFTKGLDKWDRLDGLLRSELDFVGCIHGDGAQCPEDSLIDCCGCSSSRRASSIIGS